ncbi:hypothetical protein SLA2020_458100 [Shorea laevis]
MFRCWGTLMDCDDNDFQGPNLQLAGEGSNKFSPVLRPYALSKFDFEDTLPGHLRFDSLVEGEDFLGIESTEDNQWIEDYSRASTGIGFNTSAAESCSIPRQDNVWSEATSSESVEMLLKSVGQDDIIPGQTVTRGSDVCDELGCIIKQMEPSSKHDDSSFSKVEDVAGLNPTLRSAEIPEASSELKGDLGAEQPLVEDASKTGAGDSVDGDLHSPSTGSENANIAVTEGSEPVVEKLVAIHRKEVSTSTDDSLDVSRKGDSFASSQVVTAVSSLQNTSTGSVVLDNLDGMSLKKDVGDKETDSLEKDCEIDRHNLDEHPVPTGTSHVDRSSASERKLKEDGNMIKTSAVSDPSAAVAKEDFDFHMVEGCSEAVHPGIPAQATQSDDLVLSKDSFVGDPSLGNLHDTPPLPLDSITGLKGQDVGASNDNTEICTSLESKMDSKVQIACNQSTIQEEQFLESSGQLGTKSLTGKSEESLLSLEDDKLSKGECDGSSKSYVGDIYGLNVVCSSDKLTMNQTITTFEGVHNTSEVYGADSAKICKEKIKCSNSDTHKCDQRAFVHEKQSTELPNDCSNTECGDGRSLVVDKEVCSLSSVGDKTLVSKLQCNAVAGNDSDCVPLPSAKGILTSEVDKQEVQVSLMPLVQAPADEEGSLNPTIMFKASLSNPEVSPEGRTESRLVSKSGEGVPCGAGDEFSCKAVDKSLPMVDASDSTSQIDQQAALLPAATQECSKETKTSAIFSDTTVKESGRDEATVISKKQEEGNNEENHGSASSKVTDSELPQRNEEMFNNQVPSSNNTEQDGRKDKETASTSGDKNSGQIATPSTDMESGCSSPIVIRTSEPSQSEAEKERVKGSTDQSGVASGVDHGVSKDPKGNTNDISAGDRSFTFEVPPLAELSEKETGKNWQPFPSMQQGKAPLSMGGSPPTSSLSQADIKTSEDASHGNLKASEKDIVRGGSKGSSERKPRRVSSKGTGKEAAKRGNPVKEITPPRQSVRRNRAGNASLSSSGISQLVHSNEIPHYGRVEGSSMKPFGVFSSLSSLPDLNTAASSSAMFHQPFTDLQQVQLRAQIFVYGALIQGIVPDEAYMISAFGGADGGKSLWEKNWRACIERLHGQKSHPINPETPLQSHLGAKTDQAIKQNALQNKVTSSPASRATSKGIPTTIVNPIIPLSSPLWSVPTPSGDALQPAGMPRGAVVDYQPALSPLHPHQTPPIRNFVNAPWVSQSPFRAPWVSQTNALDTSARLHLLPVTEPVNLTPARESLGPLSSGPKQVSPVPVVQSSSPANVLAGTPLPDPKKAIVAPGHRSVEPKSRKRKKVPVHEDPGHVILKSHSQTATHSAPVLTSSVSQVVSIITPNTIVSKSTEKFIMPVPPTITPVHLQNVDRDAGQKATLSEETHGKLKESQVQAMDAAAIAAAAVSHGQEIWNELSKHRNSGLAIDIETQLTSAAVAIAAAAAVAKAAAGAASVASNAALQAKLMADEALVSIGSRNYVQTNAVSSDGVKNMGQPTPASILKGEDATNSSNSIIIAAREAARRRVEAASAASKHAENMAAIVKAAELAAEAVSQAGTIVAMGKRFSLSELVEAGPEAYWRVQKVSSEQVMKLNDVNREQLGRGGHEEGRASAAHSKEVSLEKETQSANHGPSTSGKNKKGQKGRIAPDLVKTTEVVPETKNDLRLSSITTHGKEVEAIKEMNIGEGSLVEVLRVGGGSKGAWFLANVLSLRDGKACVCYQELQSEEDGDKLKEWVEVKAEGEKAPRIRIARPMTAMPFAGTRKRRRAAMGDYNWALGDRVDAWMQDSWWEGVITEKNKKDETSLTIHFPAQGETSVVKAWHLRPSLVWKDGSWVECSISGDNSFSTHEGNTPQEKRPRLRSPPVEAKRKHKVSKGSGVMESEKPDDTKLLDLATSERIFNIGKNTRNDSKPDSLRMIRTGLQKEGSRVVFGIPKPGKKRKFMEVSKHYVSDQSKRNLETNDSVKFPKYLMPQGAGNRAARSNSDGEPKEKQMAVSKPRVLKSGKPPSVSSRTTSKKDNFSNASISETDDDDATDVSKSKDSASHDENASGKHNMEFRSFSSSEGAAEGPILFSSAGLSSDATASKKTSTSNAKSERMSKGKLAPAAGKLAKIDEDKVSNGNSTKPTSEVLEPRRSNRRIQPTSRLLEGLQSSMIISKIPSVSVNKGHRTPSRSGKRE